MSYQKQVKNIKGFTLIELIIVMSIAGLLIAMVGPMTFRGLERTQAKQEMLSMKNWLKKISYRSYISGQPHLLKLSGKSAALFVEGNEQNPIVSQSFDALFFQPQTLRYSSKGFVFPEVVIGSYRDRELVVDLRELVNLQNIEEQPSP